MSTPRLLRCARCLAGLLLAGAMLAGCSAWHPPKAAETDAGATVPLLDDRFGPPSAPPLGAAEIFALSPAMRALLDTEGETLKHKADPRRALVDLLYRRDKLALEYDSTVTRTAAEAFSARQGNCLSLVIMTSALAQALGVPITYQRVAVDDAWSRVGDLYFNSGHVNLSFGAIPRPRWYNGAQSILVVDFLPGVDLANLRTERLPERTVVAMFQNNRAAEALARGALDDAYAWSRAAVQTDDAFPAALNTLGVVYLRAGHVAEARRVFQAALRPAPDNVPTLRNLAQALESEGRPAEAAAVREQLARLEPTPPFFWFNTGVQAMEDGHYTQAREMFEREIRRDPYYHEFHFWLARAELALGHADQARRQLELARQSSTSTGQQALYSAKLDRLRATTVQR